MTNYSEHKNEISRLFNAPEYKSLKYAAIVAIITAIAGLIALIVLNDDIPYRAKLCIQGFIGLGAIEFVSIVAIMSHKVYSRFFQDRYDNSKDME